MAVRHKAPNMKTMLLLSLCSNLMIFHFGHAWLTKKIRIATRGLDCECACHGML